MMNPTVFYRLLVCLLLAILGYLLFGFCLGKGNYFEYQKNRDDLQHLNQEIKRLQQRNNQMIFEIENLKTGKEAVEERAINQLDMMYPNTHFFRIIDKNKNPD